MASLQELVATLSELYPGDAEDLAGALEALHKQKLHSCDRLAKLNDSQWQRLQLPLGIEALLRDEVSKVSRQAAPSQGTGVAPTASAPPKPQRPAPVERHGEIALEEFEPEDRLVRRRSRPGDAAGRLLDGHAGPGKRKAQAAPAFKPLDLVPPDDLGELWEELMEESLPPDKRACLQETWDSASSDKERYMMYLEYASYFRKPEVSPEEREERRKQMEPLLHEFGIKSEYPEDEGHWVNAIAWVLFFAFISVLAGTIHYLYSTAEPTALHDVQSL